MRIIFNKIIKGNFLRRFKESKSI